MLSTLKKIGERLKKELAFYRCIIRHPRTPRISRYLLGLAVGYVLLPFDLIPDFIPIVGHLDDLVVIPLLVVIALKLVPAEVIQECRSVPKGKNSSLRVDG